MADENSSISDFSQLAAGRYDQLTKSEKRIANYLRKNQEEAAFLSASELADRLGLSEATLVRFARTLGFPSYPAMRSLLQQNFRARVTHSARVSGEVGLDVILALKEKGITVSADMQGYVRVLCGETLVNEPWQEMADTLKHLDILKSDAVEAEFLTGEKDIEKAAAFFANLGTSEIVLTHRDGVLIHADGKYYHYDFHSESLAGRSGRGDTCIGAYVSCRLDRSPAEAGKWAAAVTSLKVERLGVFDRPIDEVEAFIHKYYPNGRS